MRRGANGDSDLLKQSSNISYVYHYHQRADWEIYTRRQVIGGRSRRQSHVVVIPGLTSCG